jgi:hypothetical protein
MSITVAASAPPTSDRAIVFAGDAGYTRFALLAAEQIARLSPERDFDICICTDAPAALPEGLAGYGFRFCVVRTGGIFEGLRLDAGRTEVVYMRLALPQVFAAEYRRLLYYDADVFVQNGDFSALLGLDLGDHPVGAVRDNTQWRHPRRRPEQFRRLGLPRAPYFNAGMLLIDVPRWNGGDIMRRCLEFGRRHRDKMIRHDQNLLNGTLQGDWAELSPLWNWQYTRSTMLFEAMETAHVVHFIGPRKPWAHVGGALPLKFRDTYRSFIARHFPESPQIGADGLPPHRNQPYLRRMILRHLVALGSTAAYLDRFETDLSVLEPV